MTDAGTPAQRRIASRLGRIAAWALLMGVLTACATRPMGAPGDPALLRGLADGLLAPIAFVISLVTEDVRMYAFPNVGRWYDFGFLIGLSCWGGGAVVSK